MYIEILNSCKDYKYLQLLKTLLKGVPSSGLDKIKVQLSLELRKGKYKLSPDYLRVLLYEIHKPEKRIVLIFDNRYYSLNYILNQIKKKLPLIEDKNFVMQIFRYLPKK